MTTEPVDHTTKMAVEERGKLIRSFGRLDMLLFLVCAIVGLDTLGQVAGFGAQTFTWVVVLGILFLLPYGLVMAELGTAFPQEGGQYEWMKLSWGRFTAGMGAVLYWISNPLWVGGSLAFISTEAWSAYIHPVGSQTVGDYLFKMAFIWVTVFVAIIALRRGKWIPNLGAIVRIGVLGSFSVTVVIYAIEHGVHGYGVSDFRPSTAVFIGLVPLLLFNYVGFELQSGAAEEMVDPQRDVPVAVARGGVIAILSLPDPDLRDRGRASDQPGDGYRRVPRCRGYHVHGVWIGSPHPDPADGVDVHLRPGHRRRRLDHRLRPGARGCRIRRRLRRVFRRLSRSTGNAGAGECAVGHRLHRVHDLGPVAQQWIECEYLRRRLVHGDVHRPFVLHPDLPGADQAGGTPTVTRPGRTGSRSAWRACGSAVG